MLNFLRNASRSWVAKILFGGLALSFMSWGIGDMLTRRPDNKPAVIVGDVAVSADQIRADLNREVFRLRSVFGNNFSVKDAVNMGFLNAVLQQTVTRAILDMTAMDMGVTATDEAVRSAITSRPEFSDTAGQFNRDLFQHILSSSNWTEDHFVAAQRADLKRGHITGALTNGVTAPDILSAPLFTYRQEKRKAAYVLVKPDDMKVAKTLPEKELKAYYDENGEMFMHPERRSLTVVSLTPKEVLKKIVPTDEEVRAYYSDNKDMFTSPEKRHLFQMRFETEDQAYEVADRLADSETLEADFREQAKTVLDQAEADTDMGAVTYDSMMGSMRDDIFEASEGSLVGPLESDFGWHLFMVTDTEKGSEKALADVKEQIVQILQNERLYDKMYGLSNELEDTLAGGMSLEEAAKEIDLPLLKVSKMSPDGLDEKGEVVLGGAQNSQFLEEVMMAQTGRDSSLIESDFGAFVFRVDDIHEPSPKAFKEVKKVINKRLIAEKKAKLAKEKAERVLVALEKGTALKTIAKKEGVKVKKSPSLDRMGKDNITVKGITPAVRGRLFGIALKESFLVHNVGTGQDADGSFVVGTLKEIIPANREKDTDSFEAHKKTVADNISNDILVQFVRGAEKFYGSSVNNALLNELF